MLQKILIIIFGISGVFCRHVQFYRKDYTYFKQFDAFYKLHYIESQPDWYSAFFGCKAEGSQLFYPEAPEEWQVVNNLMAAKNLSEIEIPYIYVGIQNEGTEEFITIDGRTTPSPLSNYNHQTGQMCTIMDTQTGLLSVETCTNNPRDPNDEKFDTDRYITSYVCKKVEDVSCPTVDRGYKYMKENKKCYKINKTSQSWRGALNTCEMEGGLLLTIENEMEANLLLNQIDTDTSITYHAGFRMVPLSSDYYDMKGKNVKDTYWKFYDYNNANRVCGGIMRQNNNLYLTSHDCSEKLPFVCEIEVGI